MTYVFHEGQVKSVSDNQVEELKAQGANILRVPELNKLTDEVNNALSIFKKEEKRILQSTDPRDTKEVKDFLLTEKRRELERTVEFAEKEWNTVKQTIVADAERQAARVSIPITESDRALASTVAGRATLTLATATAGEQRISALNQLREEIKHYTDSEKLALAPQLLTIQAYAGESTSTASAVNGVLRELANLSTPELKQAVAIRELSQVASPTTNYRMYKIARQHADKHAKDFS
ncbi:vacuolar-type H+-ATPase subunit H [Chryseomicrobium aureum]|uniref:hypothetical protein n=1 Tax=Chryseomicrobium aureum TaxID=1441723 RepID=UPI00195617A8|nr:hypothetical protein [Chryseomicrobium aureum]MBM7707609.1 vacuolar-type H+-ATPase subunit H [Chryseomicrobium aureum]